MWLMAGLLQAESGALDPLWQSQRAQQKAGAGILMAMAQNNLSSFDIIRGRFAESHEPGLRNHKTERLYRGVCWSRPAIEMAVDAALGLIFIDKKPRLIPDWSAKNFELSTPPQRKEFLDTIRKTAALYPSVQRTLPNHPLASVGSQNLADSWIEVTPDLLTKDSQLLFRARENISSRGFGFLVEVPCAKPKGCEMVKSGPAKFGEPIRYCAFQAPDEGDDDRTIAREVSK